MFGDLPPSSSETWTIFSAAALAILRPTSVDPVKAIRVTSGCAARAAPTSPPPVTTFTTPSGNPASEINFAMSRIDTGVTSDGLTTKVQPAAAAGANFHMNSPSGEFQGRIAATTPTGSWTVYVKYV